MKRFRAGIIGCGNIFPMHAVSVSQQPNAELVAVCDNKPAVAAAAAERYHCRFYTDYRQMIDAEHLDVVHVCTPHYLHREMAVYALEHGANVLTEKPMAITLEDALAMQQAAIENKKILQVSFQNRFNPGSLLIQNTLRAGELGKILSARMLVAWDRSDAYYSHSDWKGTWEKEGGGVVIDQAIHTLDLMNWFIGEPPAFVDAAIHNRAHQIIQVDDCAEGVIGYSSGLLASFYAYNYNTWDAPIEIFLHCEKGTAELRGERATICFRDGRQWMADRDPEEKFSFGNVKQYWGVSHLKEITHLYQCLEEETIPRNTADEVMVTQRLVCAIYESGKSGKRISLAEKA